MNRIHVESRSRTTSSRARLRRAGFTLVEVLLAFLILMLGIIAVLSLFPVGMRLSQDMVQTSTSALIGKNIRGCLEVAPVDGAGDKLANYLALTYGFQKPGTGGNYPLYFPDDMRAAGSAFANAISDNTIAPAKPNQFPNIYATVLTGAGTAKITDTSNSSYSWDLRIDIGRGAFREPWSYNNNPAGGWNDTDLYGDGSQTNVGWFGKYFRYYEVEISIYRAYSEVSIGNGTIASVGGPTPSDVNLIPTCQLTISSAPRAVTTGWNIRIPSEKSDWYRIQKISPDGTVLTLDRPYAGNTGAKNGIVATGSLVGHFTTFLAAFNE